MTAFRLPLASATLALLLSCLLPPAAAAQSDTTVEPIDGIAAVVNDGVVLISELEAEIARVRARLQREDQRIPDEDVLRERVLEELVLQEIQLQRASRRGISVSDSAVTEAMRNMAEDYDTDLAGLRAQFERQGVSFEQLREDVREQLVISRLRERAVASQVQVSDQQIEDFLARMERASDRQAEIRLRHILVGLPADASTEQVEEVRTRAEQIVRELQEGARFASLATRVSDGPRALEGGDLGWRQRAQLPGLFLDAIEGKAPGSLAGPVQSPNGFHILQVVDRRGGPAQTVTEFRARHILVRETPGEDDPEGDDDARARLAELRSRVQAGADFAALASANSDDQSSAPDGGSLGWIGPGDMPPAFMQVLDNLQPGRMSEPFRSPMGWHLVQLLEQRERTDVEEFQRARARQALYRREVEQETQSWLRELRNEAFVDIRVDS